MQISTSGLNTLKNREELRLKAYYDTNGTITIGWGCTYYENGNKIKIGDSITEARAVQLLNYHVGVANNGVNENISTFLTQSQHDACVSFTYNVGVPAFAGSTLRKLINANPTNTTAIFAEWRKWKYETKNGVKVVNKGLVNRREEEIQMYSGGSGSLKKKAGSRS
jgi:lysozyme